MLTKEQIQAASDRPREWLAIPEWTPAGEEHDPTKHGVYIGTMSGKDRDSYEAELFRRKGSDGQTNLKNLRALLAVLTVQGPDGKRLFDESDTEWLGDKSSAPLSRIFDAALKLNRVRQSDVEELTKN